MTDTTITPEERAELRELAEGATPRPWHNTPSGYLLLANHDARWPTGPSKMFVIDTMCYNPPEFWAIAKKNAAYAEDACNLAPRLLDALEAAEASKAESEAENARLRAVLRDAERMIGHGEDAMQFDPRR